MGLHEELLVCPYCWESISVLLDLSLSEQSYVEDCSVCCHPIAVQYAADAGRLTSFSGSRTDD